MNYLEVEGYYEVKFSVIGLIVLLIQSWFFVTSFCGHSGREARLMSNHGMKLTLHMGNHAVCNVILVLCPNKLGG